MKKLRGVLGYAWAFLAVVIVLATFMANGYFSHKFVSATSLTVSPRLTGGDVARVNEHGSYKTMIHGPVFDGLIGERSTGFIQINWEPIGELPPILEERIELGGKGIIDFTVRLDTRSGAATATDHAGSMLPVDQAYKLGTGWAVRVLLHNAKTTWCRVRSPGHRGKND
jgi:hypothetical protein